MAETNRCHKYGGVHETVPRHECSVFECEFDYPDRLRAEIELWKSLGLETEHSERKLKFSLERAQGLDKDS